MEYVYMKERKSENRIEEMNNVNDIICLRYSVFYVCNVVSNRHITKNEVGWIKYMTEDR